MANPIKFALTFRRGDDYKQTWSLRAKDTGASLINSGDVLEFHIRESQGGSTLLTVNATPTGNGSVIDNVDLAKGSFDLTVARGDLASLPGGAQDVLIYAYAFQLTRASIRTTYAYGQAIIEPAV